VEEKKAPRSPGEATRRGLSGKGGISFIRTRHQKMSKEKSPYKKGK